MIFTAKQLAECSSNNLFISSLKYYNIRRRVRNFCSNKEVNYQTQWMSHAKTHADPEVQYTSNFAHCMTSFLNLSPQNSMNIYIKESRVLFFAFTIYIYRERERQTDRHRERTLSELFIYETFIYFTCLIWGTSLSYQQFLNGHRF